MIKIILFILASPVIFVGLIIYGVVVLIKEVLMFAYPVIFLALMLWLLLRSFHTGNLGW